MQKPLITWKISRNNSLLLLLNKRKHTGNYWTKSPGSKLRLTKFDDEIYENFMERFPEYKDVERVKKFTEEELKTKSQFKRKFFTIFEKKIEDYNFGTLLRTDASAEYGQFTTCFVVRLQFYAFEIARNKHGLNDWIVGQK